MAGTEAHIYGAVREKKDIENVFSGITRKVKEATSRQELTDLYRQAGYLITLTYDPAWDKKFGPAADDFRAAALAEFSRAAREINCRAADIGLESNYDEAWGQWQQQYDI